MGMGLRSNVNSNTFSTKGGFLGSIIVISVRSRGWFCGLGIKTGRMEVDGNGGESENRQITYFLILT